MTGKHADEYSESDAKESPVLEGHRHPSPGESFSIPEGADPEAWMQEAAAAFGRSFGPSGHLVEELMAYILHAHAIAIRHDERAVVADLVRNVSFRFSDSADSRRLIAASVRARDAVAESIDPHSARS